VRGTPLLDLRFGMGTSDGGHNAGEPDRLPADGLYRIPGGSNLLARPSFHFLERLLCPRQ